jgi:hypothetical protein
MALDIFVMPLSRYLAGDFTTRAEALARETGTRFLRIGSPKPAMSIEQAHAYVASLRQQLIAGLGPAIRWNDEGETHFAQQLPFEYWHALRAYAANLTRPVDGFRFDAGSSKHPALEAIWRDRRTPYPHLILHHDNKGFYLSTPLAKPIIIPMYEGVADEMQPRAGSSLGLLRELNELGRRLGLSRDMGEPGWTDQFDAGDPLELVKHGWVFMRQCAKISVAQKLPIIFDG